MKAKLLLNLLLIIFFISNLQAKNWIVGPSATYKFCSEVVNLVADGDTVSIQAALYDNDKQVTWKKNNLLLKGIGGQPTLKAGSLIANDANNGKGIFVIAGNNTTVENIAFTNAKAKDNNGAGIRQEGSNLIVRHCLFDGNEMGILAGGTIANCTIFMEYCEFLNGGSIANPGFQHNIYINHIDTFIFRFNFSHDAIAQGHELKSRANHNFIYYNRISNLTSVDSRNIDMPNGGTAVIVGNVIEQNQASANSNIIAFGLEGLVNPGPHNLFLAHNTIVNKKSTGSFVHVNGIDSLFMYNNVFCGAQTGGFILGAYKSIDTANNWVSTNWDLPDFNNGMQSDYSLKATSSIIDKGKILSRSVFNYPLAPEFSYTDTANGIIRFSDGKPDIGAFEFTKPVSVASSIKDLNVLIYPNPVLNILHIGLLNTKLESNIQLTDLQGRVIFSIQIDVENLEYNCSNLKAGMYWLKVLSGDAVFVQSVFKQ
jgi:hypothetical protein